MSGHQVTDWYSITVEDNGVFGFEGVVKHHDSNGFQGVVYRTGPCFVAAHARQIAEEWCDDEGIDCPKKM